MKGNNRLKIFALIGYPIGHTLSPYMHNAAFLKLKIKALYIPLLVEPKRLKQALGILRKNSIGGFNVTIPHKSTCMRYLDRIGGLASMIGAVNTVVVKGKKFFGYNTDATGLIKSLKQDLGVNAKDKKCLLIGAGGAGRAVAFILAKEGAREIYIRDVVKGKAVSLAKNIKRRFPGCKVFNVQRTAYSVQRKIFNSIDLLVNATPLGMKKTDPLPINPKLLHTGMAVYDLVYNPSPTKLVKEARKKKIKAINGLGMLLYQGAKAFELWTGRRAPVGVMRRALLEQIK